MTVLCALLVMFLARPACADGPTLGIALRDSPHGPVVSWIFPGPFGGTGTDSSAGIRRGDLVRTLAGEAVGTVEAFTTVLDRLAPGDTVTVTIRRAPDASPGSAVPDPGTIDHPDAVTMEFTVRVGSRAAWSGTLGAHATRPWARVAPDPGAWEEILLAAAGETGLRDAPGGLDALLAHLAARQQRDLDPNSVPAVVEAFRHPLRVDSIARSISARAAQAASGGLADVLALIEHVLQPRLPAVPAPASPDRPAGDPFAPIIDDLPENFDADALRLVRRLRDAVSIADASAAAHIAVIRRSPEIVEAALRRCLDGIPAWHAWTGALGTRHGDGVPIPQAQLPAQVRDAVQGDIVHVELDDAGRILLVIGGAGLNVYDMRRIACVHDLGGDDLYHFDAGGPYRQIVIDAAGNDRFVARGDGCGPGAGVFGFSVIDDRGGNDHYQSAGLLSIGAGLFGIGLILDGGGHDRFENTGPESGWSTGAGFYGAGVILSRGGDDMFLGEKLVQGVGGPRGFGAIINAAGNDLYRADGPGFPSVYGTPAVHATLGQGFGYGIRHYAAGGLGAIIDVAGNDRYEGGEFAQAGGYFWGMGIMHDAAGDDLYRGNRYGQAFAAHQAVGVLLDEGGDDAFWSMTAASQSGAWDESITLLGVRGGRNTFRCDGLGQGAAAHQSIAVLVVEGGVNQFTAAAGSTQGEGGTNEYHHARTGLFSFSALLDRGGESRFSSPRTGRRMVLGTVHESDPARSRAYGLFLRE